ncbi:MAG: RCC1 domain-containing protein [Nitrososphaeraceae archaeon]
MNSNFTKTDQLFGTVDLDDEYATEHWLLDKFVGNQLHAVGTNTYGGLGDGTVTAKSSPVQVGSLANWQQVSCGYFESTLAIKTDGTLWACGYNRFWGTLGDGTTLHRSSPVQVGSLVNWKNISAGRYHCSAIKTDGTLWTWGWDAYGQLGAGTNSSTTGKSSPIQIGSLADWKQVICSHSNSTMGIRNNGTLWGWGHNGFGALGLANTVHRSSPVQVGSLTNWSNLTTGRGFAIAVKTDGTLWAWGNNSHGQLGIGDITHRSSPVQIGSLANWKQASCGGFSSMAIKTDGTLWTWGYNTEGTLGLGDTVHRSSPVQVGSLMNWKQVCSGHKFMTATKTDGSTWSWGENTNGQLGLGNTVHRSSPVQIGSLTKWKQISAGKTHTALVTYSI